MISNDHPNKWQFVSNHTALRMTPETKFRFPEYEAENRLTRLTYSKKMSHIHFYEHIQLKFLAPRPPDDCTAKQPFFYYNKTFFPKGVKRSDLNAAFKAINSGPGWTREVRKGNLSSFVGEHDTGEYRIRLALRTDKEHPTVVSAYPVSKKCRHSHPDFFRLDEFENGYLAGVRRKEKASENGEYCLGYDLGLAKSS
jgi:hypothetical protein